MKKNKKFIVLTILSLFMVGFLTPFLRLATEGYTFPDDVARLRTSSSADFYAISESDETTRWIMQGADIDPILNFTDDISGANWYLTDITERSMYTSSNPDGDSYAESISADVNFGGATNLRLMKVGGDCWIFLEEISPYLTSNVTGNSTLTAYSYDGLVTTNVLSYTTTEFDENTITWNNQPTYRDYQDLTVIAAANGWKVIDLGNNVTDYYVLETNTGASYHEFYSTEHAIKPIINHNISKKYQGGGEMYMQTNTTESIALQSTDYGTHYNLSSGDYFEVDMETSSDSQINLILMKDGAVNKSLILSPNGNDNFNRHTVQISVDEYVEFDQLKINSTFEDEDYIKVYDIKTKKYTITGDYADFYVGSRRTQVVNLTSDIYNLRIFDPYDDGVKVNENITIGTSDYFYIYEPVETIDCRLTLFNTGKENHLDFEDYHISINRSLNGEWNTFDLLDNIFTADIGTHVYINVSDVFDTLIDSFDELASSYIDLELEVYSLQIKNLMDQKTTVDINSTHVYPLLSGESIYFILSTEYYEIGYYDNNNSYQQLTIFLNSNQAYELNRSKICFLSYADQQGNHLFFENYKTYINDSLIYENVFYREIGESINITVKDRYDIQIQSELYNVTLGDNYIPITLTLYSLKIMNLQLIFNHINITRDPNWYESEMSWSEWIAPREVIDFRLFGGNYTVNLTNYEDGGFTVYEFTLNGDDALLIGSNNTIATVLINIANVNTTLNNLVTYVQINITNLNSAINNSVVMIEINLNSINSTLGNMLVNLGLNITNVANNISALYVFTNNSFINLDNVINTSFIYMENNIASYNTSISNLVIGVNNEIYLINGTISTMISSLENNLLLMNVSIDTALFNLNTTLNLIGANITTNYILLNNSINLTNVNINDSRIAVINNLLLVNNTISTLVSQVYSAVYLINNSIYTAVVDLGTYLSLVNNTISGNLSIVLQQNEFLTELYQMTMFSDMLNWTDIGLNTSLLTSQIDVWTLINNYKNQSIEVHLRYQDLIEEIIISADDLVEQWLPAKDVEYRLWSVDDEEYLDEWTALPDNKTVSFGFFQTDMPEIPDPFEETDGFDVLMFIILFLGIITPIIGALIYFKIRKGANRMTKASTNGKYKAFSLGKDSLKYYLKRITNKKSIVKTIFIMIFLVLFLSVIIFIILRNFGFIS